MFIPPITPETGEGGGAVGGVAVTGGESWYMGVLSYHRYDNKVSMISITISIISITNIITNIIIIIISISIIIIIMIVIIIIIIIMYML